MTRSLISARLGRRAVAVTAAAGGVALTMGLTAASGTAAAAGGHARAAASFSFSLIASPGITGCLPDATGSATITSTPPNDTMKVTISGMPPNTGFDLFVIQVPDKPFGVAWYQSDIHAGGTGAGSATIRGVFSAETFSVSAGGTVTFSRPTSTTSACGSTTRPSRSTWAASREPPPRS